MIHLPPDPHVLLSYMNLNMPWWKALAELIDNALDAGATSVSIDVKKDQLTIRDNGSGCADVAAVIQMGSHRRSHRSSKKVLGRYGIGAKEAWLYCADDIEITSRRGGVKTTLRVNAFEWMENNWNISDPVVEPTSEENGTTIKLFLRSGKTPPSEDAYKTLSFVFTPALSDGISITRVKNGSSVRLCPCAMPLREDVVQADFEVNGKQVQIDIGILPDGVTIERGPFWLVYEHRVIDATSLGAGPYSVRRIAGSIILGEGWGLTKNKDDLSENTDALSEAIQNRIEHILIKADQLAETFESAALRNEVQEMINSAVSGAIHGQGTGKRDKGDKKGTVQPKDGKRKHRKASAIKENSGIVIGPVGDGRGQGKPRGRCALDWCELDSDSIGTFDRGGMRVSLNVNHPFIASIKSQGNAAALMACAMSLIADYSVRHDSKGNGLLRFQHEDFATAIGALVRDTKEVAENV